MCQVYHSNASTNQHVRAIIQQSDLTNVELANKYNINIKTVKKWRCRDYQEDKSSSPNTIHYALSDLDKELIRVVRTLTWMDLDDLVGCVSQNIPKANRSNVYRTLRAFNINQVPKEKRAKAKKFKEYKPGFLHIDVTYLPKLDSQKYYLFVAIDRATRLLYYKVYKNKTALNSEQFLKECKEYFPFYITHVLTDNGLEFTDKFVRGKNRVSGNHKFDVECSKDNIKHRLTAPATPQTNGMVERVNGIIKNSTIKATEYQNIKELKKDLNKFLIYYNINRGHGGLKRELKVRTPYEAVKSWFEIEPEIFKISPNEFYAIALNGMVQRGET
jgi:transposase InsO family protein